MARMGHMTRCCPFGNEQELIDGPDHTMGWSPSVPRTLYDLGRDPGNAGNLAAR